MRVEGPQHDYGGMFGIDAGFSSTHRAERKERSCQIAARNAMYGISSAAVEVGLQFARHKPRVCPPNRLFRRQNPMTFSASDGGRRKCSASLVSTPAFSDRIDNIVSEFGTLYPK
jgi:hypothetical protein